MREGFAWIVVEFDEVLIDWGTFRGLASLDRLLDRYAPDCVAVPRASWKWAAVDRIEANGIKVAFVSDAALEHEFQDATTNRQRAELLANQFPELSEYLPKYQPWHREIEHEAIFKALALAVAARHA